LTPSEQRAVSTVEAATPATDSRATLALVLTLLLWGSAVVGIRLLLRNGYFTPMHVAAARFGLAAVALVIYGAIVRIRLPAVRDLPGILLVTLTGVFLYHWAFNHGLVTVSAGTGSMIINTAPVFTALLAGLFLGERLRTEAWAGMLVSFAGIVLIGVGEGGGWKFAPGVWFMLIGAVAWSLNIVFQKPLLGRYSALEITTYSICLGALLFLFWAPGLPEQLRAAPSAAVWGLVYLGIVPIGLVYVLWAYVLAAMTASRAASFLYLIPVIATVVGWLVLGEVPAPLSFVGGALVLTGLVIVNRRQRPVPA
jgi:drug/metabolite transporter (DMT)-like permease